MAPASKALRMNSNDSICERSEMRFQLKETELAWATSRCPMGMVTMSAPPWARRFGVGLRVGMGQLLVDSHDEPPPPAVHQHLDRGPVQTREHRRGHDLV